MRDLQNLLRRNDYEELLLDENEFNALQSDDEAEIKKVFNNYVDYVESIKDRFIPREVNEFNGKVLDTTAIVKNISKNFPRLLKKNRKIFTKSWKL